MCLLWHRDFFTTINFVLRNDRCYSYLKIPYVTVLDRIPKKRLLIEICLYHFNITQPVCNLVWYLPFQCLVAFPTQFSDAWLYICCYVSGLSLTNWLLNGGEGFFSTVVRKRRLKRSFRIMYWTRGRSYHSLSKDLVEIWMIMLIQRQLGFDIAQLILELCDKYL